MRLLVAVLFSLLGAVNSLDDPLDLAYCNSAMDTGVIPPLPSLELLQVQVLIRHGARTPSNTDKSWPGDVAQYSCEASPTGMAVFNDGVPNSVAFRAKGWENQKFFGYKPDEIMAGGSCLQGQLVNDGYAMHLKNGQHLRDAYVRTNGNSKGLLPSTLQGNEELFYLRADSTPPAQRTLMSAEALLSGMFPGVAVVGSTARRF